MATITLLERKKKRLEQQKNKIKSQESVLKLLERKQKPQRLIELGGLIAKAELNDLENNVLLGALLDVKNNLATDPSLEDKWGKLGNDELSKNKKNTTAVVVTFSENLSADLKLKIRELGLKWNAIRKEWHGHVKLEELKDVLKNRNAKIEEV